MAEPSLASMRVADIRALAEQMAHNVLVEHWTHYLDLPVDPVSIARRMGVEVFSANLDPDVFGMIHSTTAGAEIYVDRAQPPNRYRFTVAHECGHYMEHVRRGDASAAYVDKRTAPSGYDPEETFANHFAGALLMPESAVHRWVATGRSDLALADVFGVSLQAWKLWRDRIGV